MKVILKEDVSNLGVMGTVVDVANGYGRNYLIPKNLAVEANPKNIKYFEHQKKSILTKAKKVQTAAEDAGRKLSALNIVIDAMAGEEGKLFGSVTSKDIAEAVAAQGMEIDRRKVLLDEPIKQLGTHEVQVKLHPDVTATLNVEVRKAESSE